MMDKSFDRNYGFWNEAEQECLNNSKVAIAGAGGDGFQLAVKLSMMGVKNFYLADPETFEEENSNRVFGANAETFGKNKAEVLRDTIYTFRPDAQIEISKVGVIPDNIEEFVHGADLIVDESELTHLEIGTMIAREARRNEIPVEMVMNIGFSAVATSFRGDANGKSFEEYMGIPDGMPLDEVAEQTVDFRRCLPYLPNYGDLDTLQAVNDGASLPSISHGVDVASALGSTEALLHLTSEVKNNRRQPVWAPRWIYMDSYNHKSGIIKPSLFSFYRQVGTIALRNLVIGNPVASYSQADRDRRSGL